MFNKWLNKLKKHDSIESVIFSIQSGDLSLRNSFISDYRPFIAKQVSTVCKRHITEKDDEFSIGLIAFDHAIQSFSSDKNCSFLTFSSVVIRNKLVDYIRNEAKHSRNFSIDFSSSENEEMSESLYEVSESKQQYIREVENFERKEEILLLHKKLNEFGLSFKEISENAPKHADARENAIKIALAIANNAHLKEQLLQKKRLPIKELMEYVNVSKKTVERNRKYIIAVVLILIGDFVYLKDYLKEVLP